MNTSLVIIGNHIFLAITGERADTSLLEQIDGCGRLIRYTNFNFPIANMGWHPGLAKIVAISTDQSIYLIDIAAMQARKIYDSARHPQA